MDKAPLTATCPTTLASLATIIEHLIAENVALREQLDDSLKAALTQHRRHAEKSRVRKTRPSSKKA